MPQDVPEVAVKTRSGFSIVWLVPLVALAIAGWLAYTTLAEKGPEIEISFTTAEGLEAGKTKIKYKDVEIGRVDDVVISDDLSRVIVTASMQKGTGPHLTNETRFWVVRPRLGAGGISGLGTLVSGAYIEMDPAEGKSATKFTGLEEPPVVQSGIDGTKYLLLAARLGSVSRGSPIFYRGIKVGEVMGHELAADSSEVFFHIFVKSPHDRLIKTDTRFWNASGVHVSMGADGVEVQMESLQSLLTGGIAFETPAHALSNPPAKEGTPFALHANRADIGDAAITEEYPFLAYFTGSVRGLSIGAPVEFKGIRIGSVKDIRLELGKTSEEDRVEVTFAIEPQRVTLTEGRPFENPYVGIEVLIEQGLRAQLQSGSLITGALFLGLGYLPDAPPAEYKKDGKYPEVPTIPTDFEMIARSLTGILEKVAALPLDGLVADMRSMIQATEKLVSSPDVRKSLKSMRAATAAAETALIQTQTTLASANSLIGEDSQLRHDLSQMLRELASAARSIRVLTDYLERHPEALIQGKGGGAGQ